MQLFQVLSEERCKVFERALEENTSQLTWDTQTSYDRNIQTEHFFFTYGVRIQSTLYYKNKME